MLEWIGLGGWIVSSAMTGAAGWLLAEKLGPMRPAEWVRRSVARTSPFFTLALSDSGSRFARNRNCGLANQPSVPEPRSRIAAPSDYASPRAKARQSMFAEMPELDALREEVEKIRQAERSGAIRLLECEDTPLPVAHELASMDVIVNYKRAIARLRSRSGATMHEEAQHDEIEIVSSDEHQPPAISQAAEPRRRMRA
ncbi:hypothetical protein NAP1_14418 [Erythrobacter sp. NAP1]|uniref:hypothetical protein n=1 Tax=Erythrobacter sp. NAP1 TaxID=237727 RepID=UPI00006876E2|nr:hypothetical protein [Erythrobacter sp. NAP1]EAQ28801.1 hypothetical protein NAP1_14418 [Erythrobacter sp. NAP1]